jgi:hypothetical protein
MQMKSWEEQPKIDESEEKSLQSGIHFFDFPAVCCDDTYVYFTTAQSGIYTTDSVCKLREVDTEIPSLTLVS